MNKDFLAILNKLESNTPFAFTRWGDGEWFNIRKINGKNCDGNVYYPDLGDALREIVETKQNYILGAQDTKWGLPSDVDNYPLQDWVDADVFHKTSMAGELKPLFHTLENKHIVYIGNKDLAVLPFIDEFIEIPQNNVWLNKEEYLDRIRNTFTGIHKVYCFSAGMATNVFVDILWKENTSQTFIDVGSVFDPYVGKHTRNYHKTLDL